jgi:hypothetical protein
MQAAIITADSDRAKLFISQIGNEGSDRIGIDGFDTIGKFGTHQVVIKQTQADRAAFNVFDGFEVKFQS